MLRLEKYVALVCYAALFCSCLTFLSGCDRYDPPKPTEPVARKLQTYRIGLVPEYNLFKQKRRYQPLLAYLSKQLGVTLQGVVLPRYGKTIEHIRQENLDGALLGSLTAAIALTNFNLEPLARFKYADGATSHYGIVFAKKGSNIRTVGDLRNKRMVFVDPASATGYLQAITYLKNLGINDYRKWFAESYFSGTHEDAIYDVLNGLADIGAAKNTVFYQLAERDKRLHDELEILATSPHLPADTIVMQQSIPEDLKQGLREKLLTMHLNKEGREILTMLKLERFTNTSAEDYRPVIDYANRIGRDFTN